jgi:cytoskeletal protein CcmA (bactofilin family)
MGIFSNKQESGYKSGQALNQTNQFCEGTIIEGEIKSSSDIRLDGTINGNIVSSAKVVIGEKGKVEGELQCQNGDVSGFVKGRVIVKDMLFLKATAHIEGDIIATKLVVEAGAIFNGTCRMGAIQMDNEQQHLAKAAV